MLQKILNLHNIHTPDDLDTALENYGTAYEDLYVYFLDSGEMPYGVAKARIGDPGTWLYERVMNHLYQTLGVTKPV